MTASRIWRVTAALGWAAGALSGLLATSMAMHRSWPLALALVFVTLTCLPPAGALVPARVAPGRRRLIRATAIAALLVLTAILATRTTTSSIYAQPEVRDRLLAIDDQKMSTWPVPFDDLFVDTEYGRVHVVASGPSDAPPLLLLHASGVASWSWQYNIDELSQHYRCYAVDLIGDAGLSEYASLGHVLQSGRDQADLYAAIADRLGIDRAFVVGASEGGFIGTNFALHYPERVRRLALLGPMGYAGATQAVFRIVLAQLFPLRAVQESTFAWAFSESEPLQVEFGEWFRLLMSGTTPVKVAPWPFSAEERERLAVPVLFVFGTRDRLVGDPEAASALVQDVPDARVRIVDAGHLMAAESPAEVNALLMTFFAAD